MTPTIQDLLLIREVLEAIAFFFGTCDVEHQRSMDYELKTIIMKTYAVAPTWRHGYLAYTL